MEYIIISKKKLRKKIEVSKRIFIGIIAGIISGLFAAGGGMIVVPALIHIFNLEDAKARATSVFAILPMVITSGFFYYKNNYMDWNIGIKCAIGGIIGGFIGAKLLKRLSSKILRILFIIFLIYTSIRLVM
jgi:uncharacterized membrane protein YfcA